MQQKWKNWAINLLMGLALIVAVEYWQSRHLARGQLPESLRSASLATLQGPTRSLWSPDRYTVVYVFAPWCGVCKVSGANIERLPQNVNKTALALSWDQTSEVAAFVQDSGLQLPILLGRDAEAEALGVQAFPSYIIIDTQGRIVKAWSGYTTTPGLWVRSWLARL